MRTDNSWRYFVAAAYKRSFDLFSFLFLRSPSPIFPIQDMINLRAVIVCLEQKLRGHSYKTFIKAIVWFTCFFVILL